MLPFGICVTNFMLNASRKPSTFTLPQTPSIYPPSILPMCSVLIGTGKDRQEKDV